MNLWKNSYPIIVSCCRSLTPFTEREAAGMGYHIIERTESTVVVRGGMRDMMRLNLQLRTARHVLVPLLRTECRTLNQLYDDVASIDWENLLEPDAYYTVNSVVRNDFIRNRRMASFTVKDAIADRMRTHCGGAMPESGPEMLGASVTVHWDDDEMTVFLDTTGESLSRRGYQRMPTEAPMRETLAAGCVMASGWNPATPFVAPMCGSGTPAIEAALVALNRAPGTLKSHFAFMSVKGYDRTIPGEKAGIPARPRFGGASPAEIWKEMTRRARAAETPGTMPPILASDIGDAAMKAAPINAIAAGVSQYITFSEKDFARTRLPAPPGVVFLNPPHAARSDVDDALLALYGRIGDFFKQKCAGYTGCVLTGNPALARKFGLRPKRVVPFFNGPVECRMMVYDLANGGEPEPIPTDDEIIAALPPEQRRRQDLEEDAAPMGV